LESFFPITNNSDLFFYSLVTSHNSVTQAATSQIYTKQEYSQHSQWNSHSQIDANTGVFSAQPTAQPMAVVAKNSVANQN